jgi:hypothetical protein
VLAAYAVGTALDAVLPASLGTLVMLLMFVAIIPGVSFAGVSGAFVVEKIFFTPANALVYLYLFVSVPGSFSVELGGLREHPALVVIIVVGGNSIANATSATPGDAGVNQAISAIALADSPTRRLPRRSPWPNSS